MAQAALESNWGKSAPNQNYFGIKGSGGTQTTQEFEGGRMVTKRESFRGYKSMEHSFEGYADFINRNKRYKDFKTGESPEAQIAALGRSGYATDPEYGSKINRIHRQFRGRGTQLARNEMDADLGREMTHRVEGTGKLSVDVRAPAGTKVAAEGGGLFKKVETNRQTQMPEAQEGPA